MGLFQKVLGLLLGEDKKVDETTYGLNPEKPTLTERPLVVASERTAAEMRGDCWDEVYSWRVRDFKGSLVQWLRDNGPKSQLIPATHGLYRSLTRGISTPYWINKDVFTAEGLSFLAGGKKYFFRWEALVFQVEYDLYDYNSVVVGPTGISFKPTTIHLFAVDGTEIGWVWDDDETKIGSFNVELNLPKELASRDETYVFEYQDGVSGYYGATVPVYFFVSDLAEIKKHDDELAKAREEARVAKKS